MSDSNKWRTGPISYSLGDLHLQALHDLKTITGVACVEILRHAIDEYARRRVRHAKPTSAAAVRLIERYGKKGA